MAAPKIQEMTDEQLAPQLHAGLLQTLPEYLALAHQGSVEPSVSIDHDFHRWLLEQAAALRNHRFHLLDCDNLAEELEAMAAVDRRELLRRLTTLFEHLLKLAYQPDELPRRGNSWRRAVVNSRIEIGRLLNQSPGLKRQMDEFALDAYAGACRKAGTAMGFRRDQWERTFPHMSPWSIDKALEADFFPAAKIDP